MLNDSSVVSGIRELSSEALLEKGAFPVTEAEQFTGMKRSYLYQLMDSGELPYVKMGRSRRIPRVALVRLLANSLVGASGSDRSASTI